MEGNDSEQAEKLLNKSADYHKRGCLHIEQSCNLLTGYIIQTNFALMSN